MNGWTMRVRMQARLNMRTDEQPDGGMGVRADGCVGGRPNDERAIRREGRRTAGRPDG